MSKFQITLNVLDVQLRADGGMNVITRKSSNNPSDSGVHVFNAAQTARICQRCLGVQSPIALKHAVAMSNGGATLTLDAEKCVVGQTWTNEKTGETGKYGFNADGSRKLTKDGKEVGDWINYNNHELHVGVAAQAKMLELSFASALAGATQAPVQTAAPAVAAAPVALGVTADTKSDEQPTV